MPDDEIPAPDRTTRVGGRRVVYDDRGDPAGRPVLYFHGTPDCRLSRHPDDGLAEQAGVRLIAVDRPGVGRSESHAGSTPGSVADDHLAVLDDASIDRVGVLAWSAGAIFALAFAARHPTRVDRVVLAGPLAPVDAYDDPTVVDSLTASRAAFVEFRHELAPDELGRELAPWLGPAPLDDATARLLLHDLSTAVDDIDGATDQLVLGRRGAVIDGQDGVAADIAAQAVPLRSELELVRGTDVRIHVGDHDAVCPPPMAEWLARATGASLTVVPDAGHELALRQWGGLLDEAAGSPVASHPAAQSTDDTSDQRRSSS